MPERINAVKTTFFGKGAVKLLGPELRKTGIKRALLITDRFLYKSGLCEKLAAVLSESGIEYAVYYEVKPNPTVTTVNECIAAARAIDAKVLIALGGGSAIDTAKAVSIVMENGGTVEQYEGVDKSIRPGLPLVIINTTAGTGSECTTFYIITDPKRHSKMAMVDINCMAAIAVNDTDFMSSMPPKLTAATGMDALTHAIEAVFSKNATPITDKDAVWAITAITEYLPRAVRNGADEKARTMMSYAENVAGMAFSNAGLGMVHAMAHSLGGHYNLPHGVCNAVLLPYVLRFDSMRHAYDERFAVVARAMGLDFNGACCGCGAAGCAAKAAAAESSASDTASEALYGAGTGYTGYMPEQGLSHAGSVYAQHGTAGSAAAANVNVCSSCSNVGKPTAAEAVINNIIQMNSEIGISSRLSELTGVDPADFKALTALAMHDTCMESNLVPVTAQEFIAAFTAAYNGTGY